MNLNRRELIGQLLGTLACGTPFFAEAAVVAATSSQFSIGDRVRRAFTLPLDRLGCFRIAMRLKDGTLIWAPGMTIQVSEDDIAWRADIIQIERTLHISTNVIVDDEGYMIAEKPFKFGTVLAGDQVRITCDMANPNIMDRPALRIGT